jgi:hypothetical protein
VFTPHQIIHIQTKQHLLVLLTHIHLMYQTMTHLSAILHFLDKENKMSQAIIFTNSNGGVSVCIPTGELPIEQVKAKDTPAGSIIVNTSDLPNQDNDFFDAWEMDDRSVTVSLAKAKEITKTRLREEREPLLAAQDVAFQASRQPSGVALVLPPAQALSPLRFDRCQFLRQRIRALLPDGWRFRPVLHPQLMPFGLQWELC